MITISQTDKKVNDNFEEVVKELSEIRERGFEMRKVEEKLLKDGDMFQQRIHRFDIFGKRMKSEFEVR